MVGMKVSYKPCADNGLAAANGILLQQIIKIICFGVGVAVGIGCMISAIRQGQVCANGIVGISQGHDVQTNTMIYAAFPEFYAILALVGALMPVFLL